jgi:hypothetical protein
MQMPYGIAFIAGFALVLIGCEKKGTPLLPVLRKTEMDSSEAHSPATSLPADLERELGRQILASEKLRAEIQAGMGAALFVIVGIIGGVHVHRGTPLPGVQMGSHHCRRGDCLRINYQEDL